MKQSRMKVQVLVLLLLSLIVGYSVYSYLGGVRSEVESQYETRSAVVVTKQVPAGSTLNAALDDSAIGEIQFPQSEYPEGALESIDGLDGELVARYTLQPGQIVLRESFGTQSIQSGSLLIPDGLMAISVSASESARVGSFIRPGSRVTVYASGQLREDSRPVTQTLLSGALVLAVGGNIDPSVGQASGSESTIVTLAVSASQAKRLVHAAQYYSLYFGIIGPKVQFDLSDPVTSESLFQN